VLQLLLLLLLLLCSCHPGSLPASTCTTLVWKSRRCTLRLVYEALDFLQCQHHLLRKR
jgi:hypothetical protein